MVEAPLIGDNLAARIAAILLGTFVVLALAVAAVMLWPRPGDGQAGLFRLPFPEETAVIARALEVSSPRAQPAVIQALNTGTAMVRLQPDFPPAPPGLVRSPGMEDLFRTYSASLQGRPFRVDVRQGFLPVFSALMGGRAAAPLQMSVRLRTGQVLVIERRPGALVRSYITRAMAIAGVLALTLFAALTLAVRQTVQPVKRLASAARAFSLDGEAPDLPVGGPPELRELSHALNDMQHRIQALSRERTRVLGAVAHDLRTYLTRLRLRLDYVEDPDQRNRAERDLSEMAQLLDDVLLFSERSARLDLAALAPIDLVAEVSDIVAVRRGLGQSVSGPVGAGAPMPVRSQKLTLRRMVDNLVDNALRYGEAARLSLEADAQAIALHVDDDGPGVPPEALARILEPFERLESSRGRATGGAGLGLAIVKGLADVHGVTLRLENRAQGGFRASLLWPRDTG